jgi:hypothetical protein
MVNITINTEVIDANIGDANYDIGHNTEDSGNAGCIGCVCTTGSKGSGMTGVPNPTGDSFDIDYVAQIGHQMGGYHTHNGTGNCRKVGIIRSGGSGSSIMLMLGLGQNVQ